MTDPNQGLHRSEHDRMIAGVCGGLAESLRADPTLVRLAWVLLTLVSWLWFLGIGFYLLAWFVLPVRAKEGEAPPVSVSSERAFGNRRLGQLIGWLLVGVGIVLLADRLTGGWLASFWHEFRRYFWPILLIAVGGALLIHRGSDRGSDER
ncbi:MAG: PspC domain-containing protein [Bacteroidota bacterium]